MSEDTVAASEYPLYPPQLSEEQLSALFANIRDWQLNHGSLLKLCKPEFDKSMPVGVSLFPCLFPRACFEEACGLQTIYNKLYALVGSDEGFLLETLKDLIDSDAFTETLWNIHEQVKDEGYVQDLSLGLFRSDYMLDVGPSNQASPSLALKQVEFNTYSIAGGVHANKVADMHRYMARTGTYQRFETPDGFNPISTSALPANSATKSLAAGLAAAHEAYGLPKSGVSDRTGILFVVQPNNINVCDERPIEYVLGNHETSIVSYRLDFGQDILNHTFLSPTRELLYHPPTSPDSVEISVVYMRAGYDVHEYDSVGCAARFHLERSRAIKCPSLLTHLATFKKIQQALTGPGTLERFQLSFDEVSRVTKTFAPMYPLDDSSMGRRARVLAQDPVTAVDFVLKPSLEGGGHNIYRADIAEFLRSVEEDLWGNYILMELIKPPAQTGILASPRGLYAGPVVSELGIFGACLWRRTSSGAVVIRNSSEGWSFKTKPVEVNEMSVVKGYGCFDTPCLVSTLPIFTVDGKT